MSRQKEVEKIEVEIGGETKQLTPAELERLQAQLTLKRPNLPATVNTKEEQDAPPEPVVSKSQALHQAYKRARVLDVHQGVISPSETPAPSMPVDAQGSDIWSWHNRSFEGSVERIPM